MARECVKVTVEPYYHYLRELAVIRVTAYRWGFLQLTPGVLYGRLTLALFFLFELPVLFAQVLADLFRGVGEWIVIAGGALFRF